MFEIPSSSVPIDTDRLLYTPPDGSRLYSRGLLLVGDCWTPGSLCLGCRNEVGYDDSWDGLQAFLDDHIYRPELAPWYSTQVPESAEFGGVWVMDVKGLDSAPSQREITELAGSGGAAMPQRDAVRKIAFEAVLFACTNAGLDYGMKWLSCQLRDTNDKTNSVLRYLSAHPQDSAADPATLMREAHGVVLTTPLTVMDSINASSGAHRQATAARVQWELAVTRPYTYYPSIGFTVDWDTELLEPVQWVHAAECDKPETGCDGVMPVLFSQECQIEHIKVVVTPPPSCGGCMPVCAVMTRVYEVPTFDYPIRCNETAVSLVVKNTDYLPLTIQGYWRRCNALPGCDDERWPVQITGLPGSAELHLDAISGTYWAFYDGWKRRPVGILSTPTGAPWRPPIIDRALCWEFVVTSADTADFDITMTLSDREA